MTGPAPLDGAREALARCRICGHPTKPSHQSPTGWTHTGGWEGKRCPSRVTGAQPLTADFDALLAALSSAGYMLVRPDLSDATPLPAEDDMPELCRRMLTGLLDTMGPEAMGEVLADAGYTLVKDDSTRTEYRIVDAPGPTPVRTEDRRQALFVAREFNGRVEQRQVGPWVPVSGEGKQP